MKNLILPFALTLFFTAFSSGNLYAQGGPPPPPAGLWLDKGAIFLLIVCAIIGAKKVMDFQNRSTKTESTSSHTEN